MLFYTQINKRTQYANANVRSPLTIYLCLYKSGDATPTRLPIASNQWLIYEYIFISACYVDRWLKVEILPVKDRETCQRRRGIFHCRRAARLSSYAYYGQKAAVCCAQDWTELSNKHKHQHQSSKAFSPLRWFNFEDCKKFFNIVLNGLKE